MAPRGTHDEPLRWNQLYDLIRVLEFSAQEARGKRNA